MSHAIYQTEALILKTKNMSESNKLVYLYTQKFGLIYANMQSLRELRSKMRYHIHPYSLVDVDVVSGKSIWRITGVHEKIPIFNILETPWYRLVSIISDTLVRLCTGEEQNQNLWDEIILFFDNFVLENEKYSSIIEIIIMVRILHTLGYWEYDDVILSSENPYTKEIFTKVKENKIKYIKKINEALYDSQL